MSSVVLPLQQYELPDESPFPALPDPEFDRIAALTRRVLDAPVALVSLPNKRCQVFPGASGLTGEWETARTNGLEYSYCQHVVRSAEPLVVADARDVPELEYNLSIPAGFVAYAGMPLLDDDARAIGSLCVLDDHPRTWTSAELELLEELAALASSQIRLRQANARAAITADRDRIGRELGQGVIRELFGLSMSLGHTRSQVAGGASAELTRAIECIDDIIANIRRSVFSG